MQLSTKVAYNSIIQIASKIFGTILVLIAAAVITRYLGQTGFGEYTTITTYLSFFAVIADLGLTLVTTQMISRPSVDRENLLGNLLALRLVSAVFFLALAPLTVLFLPYDASIKYGVLITAVAYLFVALNQILVGLFQKELRMDKVAIAETAGRLMLVAGAILAVYFKAGLLGILLATIVGSGVSFLIHYLFSLSFARLKFRFELGVWKSIIKKSWPLSITIVLNLVYLRADTLLLSLLPRPSAVGIIAEVGLYGAAYKVIDIISTVPFMLSGIVLPILTVAWAEENRPGFARALQKTFEMMAIIAIPLAVGAQFVAKDLIVLVAGPGFAASAPILRILILAIFFIFLGNIFSHAIIAIDKQAKTIPAYLFTAATAVVGYLIFIPRYAYFGAAWVTIYSEFIIAAAAVYFVWKYSSFFPDLVILVKSLGAALIMAIAIVILKNFQNYSIISVLIISPIVYFTFLYIFKGLNKKDLLLLVNK